MRKPRKWADSRLEIVRTVFAGLAGLGGVCAAVYYAMKLVF